MKANAIAQDFLVVVAFIFVTANTAYAQTATISLFPSQIIQGDPIMVQVIGKTISDVRKITFDGKKVGVFMYHDKPTALVGIDLNKKPGMYEIVAILSGGGNIKNTITVGERKKIEAPLSIPAKLGGDTVESQNKLVRTLASENKSLATARTGTKAFWKTAFEPPLREIFVTDEYGYSRITGAYSIHHKGADYRAKDGTPVMAMNRGAVRIAKTYRNYGKTIVIDHGLGLMTLYMHLGEIYVNTGELVTQGEVIGLSGQTGYSEMPHLHLTVRINGTSIDPVKFMELFR